MPDPRSDQSPDQSPDQNPDQDPDALELRLVGLGSLPAGAPPDLDDLADRAPTSARWASRAPMLAAAAVVAVLLVALVAVTSRGGTPSGVQVGAGDPTESVAGGGPGTSSPSDGSPLDPPLSATQGSTPGDSVVDPSGTSVPPASVPGGPTTTRPGTGQNDGQNDPTPTTNPTPPITLDVPGEDPAGAPTVTVTGGFTRSVQPYSFCSATMCADGIPTDPPDDVGSSSSLTVEIGASGWNLFANLSPVGGCRAVEAPVTRLADGRFRVDVVGPAGAYDVSLFAQATPGAPVRGDVAAAVRWTSTASGAALPGPRTYAIVVTPGGESYGDPSVFLEHIGSSARLGSASVVISRDGRTTAPIPFAQEPEQSCDDGRSRFFTNRQAVEAALATAGIAPGGGSMTLQVTLVLGGVTYVATAPATASSIGPGGEICRECAKLDFSPALPGYDT